MNQKTKHICGFLIVAMGVFVIGVSMAYSGADTIEKSVILEQDKTLVVVCFDVEDYVTPASEGVDDIPMWLADILTEEGVPGTFFVIGEKARSLEKRGRDDVIQAMARHDIGSHTDLGSIHPTITEILEKAGWQEGVEKMFEQESRGFKELERIFGQPVSTLGRHGGSYGPQLVGALAEMGAGFVYSPIRLPGHNAVWFCNALNFYGSYGGFDDNYYRDDLFDPLLEDLAQRFPKDIQNVDVLTFFACHPCKVRTVQFWDFNYYQGANPGPDLWKMPELRPAESMETARKNFRRLMRFLKERQDITLTTFADLMERFSHQRECISQDSLAGIATRILAEREVVIDDYYSPAEVFSGLAESLAEFKETGSLPRQVKRRSPFGPAQMPIVRPEIDVAFKEQVFGLADESLAFIQKSKALPPWLVLDNHRVGLGSLLALFSDMFLCIRKGAVPGEFNIPPFDAHPVDNLEDIVTSVEGNKSWPVHREDLDMRHLVEMTKMQLWTLKPAIAIGDEP
jgi:peptidoglycan/xylan/chitin deacetylase (PgdA/CDA1 family)